MNSNNRTNTINTISSRTLPIYISIILLLFIISYHSVLSWMYGRYMSSDSYYSHGFIIPFLSAFLVWRKRENLRDVKTECSWWGLLLIIVSALIHITGTILYVFSVSGFSIFFLILGMSLFLFGKNISRVIIFPLVFLIFMFPVPEAFISVLSFPLKIKWGCLERQPHKYFRIFYYFGILSKDNI